MLCLCWLIGAAWLVALWVACRAGGLLVGRCLAVCGGRPLPLRAPMRFGRGVRPSSVTTRCCFSRSLPVWFPPLAAVFRLGYLGFLFLRLARLLVAPGRPLTFPRLVCFFPFVRQIISYFTDNYQLNVI